MRAVVQRVHSASVSVDGHCVGAIDGGLLVYLAVAKADNERVADELADKIRTLRIFEDDGGKLNLSVEDRKAALLALLAVPAFTVLGDARKGRRPAFVAAAEPLDANRLFERFCQRCRDSGLPVETGAFRTHMHVESVNDGPICILLDSTKMF